MKTQLYEGLYFPLALMDVAHSPQMLFSFIIGSNTISDGYGFS